MRLTTHVTKLVLVLILGLTFLVFLILLVPVVLYFCRKRRSEDGVFDDDVEKKSEVGQCYFNVNLPQSPYGRDGLDSEEVETGDLVTFGGGEDLTIADILEAPGEVVGKSNYGTLYKAVLNRVGSVLLLRFLRPVCTEKVGDFEGLVRVLGQIRHGNLVPLLGFYGGPRGEKLLVHPYYKLGNLTHFILDGNGECRKWEVIYRIATGIAKALDHLHTGLPMPVIHGNLKSKNILLDRNSTPRVSDFGLHLLLNPNAAQEMLEASAAQGYKAPELMKLKEVTKSTDVYSLGVLLLELLAGREAVSDEECCYLQDSLRSAILDHEITELFHPDIVVEDQDRVVKLFQLAMACCSPSPLLRPDIKQIVSKIEEIGR